MLSRLRALVKEADPEVVEEWKWRGVPVWSHDGIICTGETYKNVVKMTFAKGAALEDPSGLFNSSLEGNTRRAIDFREGEKIDEGALKALVRAAVTLNKSKARKYQCSPATSPSAHHALGNDLPLVFIVGPNTLESRAHALETSAALAEIANRLKVGLIYKTSFDKANRSSIGGERGIGLLAGLPILAQVREDRSIPVGPLVSRTSAKIGSPFSRPMPRSPPIDERFALSNEVL